MSTHSAPLIARLRRYLRVVVLLCLGLVVMKSGVAAACIVDELSDVSSTRVVLTAPADKASDVESCTASDPAACWHDEGGGCHCVCAHGLPLLPPTTALRAVPASSEAFVLAARDVRPAPRDDHLRPPIA
jgi:hypothetical protein